MQYSKIAVAALVGAATASPAALWERNNGTGPAVVTEVVTQFTTVCPSPTTFAVNNKTYTVTSSTTLTITNCPCTITRPANRTTLAPPATKPAPVTTLAPPAVKPTQAPPATATASGSTPQKTIVAAGGSQVIANVGAVLAGLGVFMLV